MQSVRRYFLPGFAAAAVFFAATAMANNHYDLNGVWRLIPARSDFAGQPVIETGTVTIHDRQHNIYIERSFGYDGTKQSYSYSFATDGRENSTIRNESGGKTKAKWEGDTLVVKTTQGGLTTVEQFRLMPDGTMQLIVDRPEHAPVTLFFQHQ